jgi:hypothetical protein
MKEISKEIFKINKKHQYNDIAIECDCGAFWEIRNQTKIMMPFDDISEEKAFLEEFLCAKCKKVIPISGKIICYKKYK